MRPHIDARRTEFVPQFAFITDVWQRRFGNVVADLAPLQEPPLTFVSPSVGIAPSVNVLRAAGDDCRSRRFKQNALVWRAFDFDAIAAPNVKRDQMREERTVAEALEALTSFTAV